MVMHSSRQCLRNEINGHQTSGPHLSASDEQLSKAPISWPSNQINRSDCLRRRTDSVVICENRNFELSGHCGQSVSANGVFHASTPLNLALSRCRSLLSGAFPRLRKADPAPRRMVVVGCATKGHRANMIRGGGWQAIVSAVSASGRPYWAQWRSVLVAGTQGLDATFPLKAATRRKVRWPGT